MLDYEKLNLLDFENDKEGTLDALRFILVSDGDSIFEEIDELLKDNYDYELKKIFTCCSFALNSDKGISKDLKSQCENYIKCLDFYFKKKDN